MKHIIYNLLLIACSIFSFDSHAENYAPRFGISIDPNAIIGYESIQLTGYSVNRGAVISLPNQPVVQAGMSFRTPPLDTGQALPYPRYLDFSQINLIFSLQSNRLSLIRNGTVNIAIRQVIDNNGVIYSTAITSITGTSLQTDHPTIRVNFNSNGTTFNSGVTPQLNFNFTEITPPLINTTIVQLILLGSY